MSERASIEIGRLLRSSTSGCVVGCRVNQMAAPALGAMVRIPLQYPPDLNALGVIYDINLQDDEIVRSLIGVENISPEVIEDNRNNRNVPVELSVLFIGYSQAGRYHHLLPPRPPLTLDAMYACSDEEIIGFTGAGHLGYLRHILRAEELPVGELLAAHIKQAGDVNASRGDPFWVRNAVQELIVILRDDYRTLMAVLSAMADADLGFEGGAL